MARKVRAEELKNTKLIGWELLANQIVLQAINDWKELCNGKREQNDCNFSELERFFNSDYCEFLLQGTQMTGAGILKELKKLREGRE